MNPKDLKYTPTHEWVRLEGGTATVGITEHAAHALSDDLPTINHDPYGKGWLIKVKLKGQAPSSLLGSDQYDKLVAESA